MTQGRQREVEQRKARRGTELRDWREQICRLAKRSRINARAQHVELNPSDVLVFQK